MRKTFRKRLAQRIGGPAERRIRDARLPLASFDCGNTLLGFPEAIEAEAAAVAVDPAPEGAAVARLYIRPQLNSPAGPLAQQGY